jgi:hypothetical protein
MSSQIAIQIVIGVAVLALLIYRQLRARPVSASVLRIMAILAAIGLYQAVQYFHGNGRPTGTTVYVALGGSLVLAAVFAVFRAMTVRLFVTDGQVWQQGSWLTAVLWVAALATHLGYDAVIGQHKDLAGVGSATVLLYLAVSFGIQRVIVQQRAHRLQPAAGFGPGQPAGGPFG